MRRLIIAMITLAAVPLVSAGSHYRNHQGNHGMNITTSFDSEWNELDRCDQIKVTVDDEPAARAEEELPVASLRSLKMRSDQNGGIHVIGWSSSHYAVTACKAAAFPEQLRDVHVSVSGNEVRGGGPDRGNWMIFYIVHAPKGAVLDLETSNGGISLHHIDGTVTARAMNGPISVKDSTGKLDLDTTNGPISLAGDSGDVKMSAQNGPISIKLAGSSWNGSLDARTENGPLSVKIGSNYRSGVVIESDGHGPISCRAAACRSAKRTWDDDDDNNRRIELGSGPTVVHMSTVNGPVSVKED
jgi:hypothetical protein